MTSKTVEDRAAALEHCGVRSTKIEFAKAVVEAEAVFNTFNHLLSAKEGRRPTALFVGTVNSAWANMLKVLTEAGARNLVKAWFSDKNRPSYSMHEFLTLWPSMHQANLERYESEMRLGRIRVETSQRPSVRERLTEPREIERDYHGGLEWLDVLMTREEATDANKAAALVLFNDESQFPHLPPSKPRAARVALAFPRLPPVKVIRPRGEEDPNPW